MKLKIAFMSPGRAGLFAGLLASLVVASRTPADTLVYLTDVPDYLWYAGCFGTASGNLAGYWDRHGMTNFYSGPTGNGVAPLDSGGDNFGIRTLWTSKAGMDGRPANQPGHIDDYYSSGDGNTYDQSTAPDPYVIAGRNEHRADCIGDFIGLSQNKWTNLNNECRGNIDAYSFVFWEKSGRRRINFYATNAGGIYIPDIQSGFKEWARYRGYDADVFTQLADFNPERTNANTGFTFDDVKAEIDAGYPLLCFLQRNGEYSRSWNGVPNVNPVIHGVMIFGYYNDSFTGIDKGVIIRTSWGSGDIHLQWTAASWLGLFPVRGVIGFHPKPKVTRFSRDGGNITLNWDGPTAQVNREIDGQTTLINPHRYCIQRATSLNPPNWKPVAGPTTSLSITFADPTPVTSFYRVVQIGQGNCP